jgi:hypothetical protein
MKNCTNCHHPLELSSKFCPNCGNQQPENSLVNESNPLVGDKNVISTGGGDITGTKITGGNVSFTNVHHAQDDTKKRVRCFYTGQGVALEDLMNCPSCKKDVARSYFNFSNKRCYHCDDTSKEEYTQLMRGYLSDGRLDSSEIKELQMHQIRLLLTEDETTTIENSERERLAFVKTSNISDKELRDLDDLAKLFELNKHIKQGDSIISVLYKKYPQSPEVSFYYFLNEFDKKDRNLYDLALSTREDNLFAYYFGGIAAELEGKTEQSQKIIEKLSLVYDEYFYLNDALKLLSLAEKFEYQRNKLISDKIITLLNEIDNSSLKGIYLSAYLGLIGYVDNYCCNAENAALLAKHSDATSAALGYFFINIREEKFLAQKRKIEAQKQAELERVELEKLEKRKAEEKAKAEAYKIEQEKKEKIEEQKRLEREKLNKEKKIEEIKNKEIRDKRINSILDYFLKKDQDGKSTLTSLTSFLFIILFLGGAFAFWIIPSNKERDKKEEEAKELSVNLELIYERIDGFILKNQLDSAYNLLTLLIHPSTESSTYDKNFFEKYKYNEYWQIKREELKQRIITNGTLKNKEELAQNNENAEISTNPKELSLNLEDSESDEMDDEYLYDINHSFGGNYKGLFGDKKILLNISNITSKGDVIGYNILGDKKRVLSGTFKGNLFELAEPGDDTWDGVFKFTVNDKGEAIGTWTSNNGKLKRSFSLFKDTDN